jgi:hypothetical protein
MKYLAAILATIIFLLAAWYFPAHGAFPAVATTGHAATTPASTTINATVPSGIAAGNLLLLFAVAVNPANEDTTFSGLTGWTQLCTANEPSATFSASGEVYYKFASGSETNFTFTASASIEAAVRIWRITGAHASTPPECTATVFTGDVANSDSLTVSWGSADNLWFSLFGKYNCNDAVTAYPASYTSNQYEGNCVDGDPPHFGVSSRENATDTENPGAYTMDSGQGVEFTIGIRPAAAPAVGRRPAAPIIFQ